MGTAASTSENPMRVTPGKYNPHNKKYMLYALAQQKQTKKTEGQKQKPHMTMSAMDNPEDGGSDDPLNQDAARRSEWNWNPFKDKDWVPDFEVPETKRHYKSTQQVDATV